MLMDLFLWEDQRRHWESSGINKVKQIYLLIYLLIAMGCFRLKLAYVLAWVGKKRGEGMIMSCFLNLLLRFTYLVNVPWNTLWKSLGSAFFGLKGRVFSFVSAALCKVNREGPS